ncbi:MAG: AAA family ATPase, partial [Chitinophagales bacterium]
MKANLKIKNFGPIISLDVEIRKFNILIGPQAAGKSTISKVLCIIHMFDYYLFTPNDKIGIESIKQLLSYYR